MEEITREKLQKIANSICNDISIFDYIRSRHDEDMSINDFCDIERYGFVYGNSYNNPLNINYLLDGKSSRNWFYQIGAGICSYEGCKNYIPLLNLIQIRDELNECISEYELCLYKELNEDQHRINKLKEKYSVLWEQAIQKIKAKQEKEKRKQIRQNTVGYVYIIKIFDYYKIGQTSNPDSRFGEYTKLMEDPETIICQKCNNYTQVEIDLHSMFNYCRTNGEWFKLSNEDLEKAIEYIKSKKAI